MGNTFSSVPTGGGDKAVDTMSSDDSVEEFHDTIEDNYDSEDRDTRVKAKEAEMEEFRRQLQIKREQRREILNRHKMEKKELETSLENEKKAKSAACESNRMLRELLAQNNIDIPENLQCSKEYSDIKETVVNMQEEFEKLRANNNRLRRDLVEANSALQGANSDIIDLHGQNTESMKQINALKEVIAVSKTMLALREQQLNELKEKLSEIERSLADREASMLSSDLRQEYERQLQNIRTLRGLYEERARLAEVTRQGLLREIEEQKTLKLIESDKVKDLTTKVEELEARVDELQETVTNKNNQIYSCQEETRRLKEEMSAVNKLFSQVLLGYKSPQDLDKLVHRLEENHGLLTHMAEKENDSEASSALPKLLLEIVSQVDDGEEKGENKTPKEEQEAVESKSTDENDNAQSSVTTSTTAEEIVQNLPKVWRVLMELLSHQTAPDDNATEKVTTCYKTVETKSGPVQVPSVSQTYIRLKDLIVEKLALIKEVNRMKQLNGHLETRLGEQERKLCLVTSELSKTWHVVGRLRRHHHQLHTHEKILKYELQQKRKLLNELKEELEYCREKWEQAREKNSQSEKDWRKLRAEFSSRKAKSNTSFNNSAESGYSDERPSDESSESNDESEYVTEPLTRSKKKLKKSFETILDSSTDFNLAAEREDPASDMLDVADLPLDTHDGDDHHDISDSCNSESLLKSERVCEETEDEVGDIAHDSCAEDLSIADNSQCSDSTESKDMNQLLSNSNSIQQNVPTIDPAAILKSIQEQNERLAKKDKKLERLEKSSAALLQNTQNTAKLSDQINDTLDHLLNRPTSTKLTTQELSDDSPETGQNPNIDEQIYTLKVPTDDDTIATNNTETNLNVSTNVLIESSTSNQNSTEPDIDFKAILENGKHQNERLAKKDERLQTLENECMKVTKDISETLKVRDAIVEKLNSICEANSSSENETSDNTNKTIKENTTSTNNGNLQILKVNDKVDDETQNCTQNVTLRVDNKSNESEVTEKEITNYSNSIEISNELSTSNCFATNDSNVTNKYKVMEDMDNASNVPSTSSNTDIPAVDFKEILENVKRQNETLNKKDERLQKLEEGCNEVVSNLSNTLLTGEEIIEKLDSLHNASGYGEENTEDLKKDEDSSGRDSSEPSTSSEIDHEAIFAARDIRLKRLEEQTKSLVNKVNKTTDKGVKIHYKLEELHNIYGSEGSRASTPSDNEERDKANDTDSQENDEKSN